MKRILSILMLWPTLLWAQSPASIVLSDVPTPTASCVVQRNGANTLYQCNALSAASQPLTDAAGLIMRDSDHSKILAFNLAAITTATTRTWTIPDANITVPSTIAQTGGTNTFTGLQTLNGGLAATTGTFSSTLDVSGATTITSTASVAAMITKAASTSTLGTDIWLRITGGAGSVGNLNQLSFGYGSTDPVIIGSRTTTATGNTNAAFFVATRSATTGAPTERLSVDQDGLLTLAAGLTITGKWALNTAASPSLKGYDGTHLVVYTSSTSNVFYSGGSGGFSINNGADTQQRLLLSDAGVLTINALASGNLTSASGVITSSSDERLKDILGPLDYGLAEVLALKPIRYHWNAASGIPTEPEYGGFGAAQVEQWMPLAVSYGTNGMRGLNTTVILAAVVNGEQELDARLQAVEAKLAMPHAANPLATPAKVQQEIADRKAKDSAVATKRAADAKVKEIK